MPSQRRGLLTLLLTMGKEHRAGSVCSSPVSPSFVPFEVQELPTQSSFLFTVRDKVAQKA